MGTLHGNTTFTQAFGHCLDPSVILESARVKDRLFDTLDLHLLRQTGSDDLCLLGLGTLRLRLGLTHAQKGHVRDIIDNLYEQVSVTLEDTDARSFGGTRNLRSGPGMTFDAMDFLLGRAHGAVLSSRLLTDLAADDFILIANTGALIGLGWTLRTNQCSDVTDRFSIHAAHDNRRLFNGE